MPYCWATPPVILKLHRRLQLLEFDPPSKTNVETNCGGILHVKLPFDWPLR